MSKIKEYTQYRNVTVVELCNGEWGVVDVAKRQVIVPFGKYNWISECDYGLARVRKGKDNYWDTPNGNKWGIINMEGEEVVPVEYDKIWNFAGKRRWSTNAEKDGEITDLKLWPFSEELNEIAEEYSRRIAEMEEREYDRALLDDFSNYTVGDYSGIYDDWGDDRWDECQYDAYMDGEYVPDD